MTERINLLSKSNYFQCKYASKWSDINPIKILSSSSDSTSFLGILDNENKTCSCEFFFSLLYFVLIVLIFLYCTRRRIDSCSKKTISSQHYNKSPQNGSTGVHHNSIHWTCKREYLTTQQESKIVNHRNPNLKTFGKDKDNEETNIDDPLKEKELFIVKDTKDVWFRQFLLVVLLTIQLYLLLEAIQNLVSWNNNVSDKMDEHDGHSENLYGYSILIVLQVLTMLAWSLLCYTEEILVSKFGLDDINTLKMNFSSTLESPSTSQASSDEKLDFYRIRQEEKIFSSLSLPAPIFIAYLMGFIFTSFQFFVSNYHFIESKNISVFYSLEFFVCVLSLLMTFSALSSMQKMRGYTYDDVVGRPTFRKDGILFKSNKVFPTFPEAKCTKPDFPGHQEFPLLSDPSSVGASISSTSINFISNDDSNIATGSKDLSGQNTTDSQLNKRMSTSLLRGTSKSKSTSGAGKGHPPPHILYYKSLSPELNNGLFSEIYFAWLWPLMKYSYFECYLEKIRNSKKKKEVCKNENAQEKASKPKELNPHNDVFPLLDTDQSIYLSCKLMRILQQFPESSLFWNLIRFHGYDIIAQYCYRAFAALTLFIGPLALKFLVNDIQKGDTFTENTSLYILLMFVGPVLNALGDSRSFALGRRMGGQARSALISIITRKLLVLDITDSSYSPGELTNMIAVDTEAVLDYLVMGHQILGGIESFLLTVILLYYFLGLSSLVGITLVILTTPLNNYLTSKLKQYTRLLMKRKDARMSLFTEVIYGLKVIKLFAWERSYIARIEGLREAELEVLGPYITVMGILTVIMRATPPLVALVTFVVHTKLLGKTLTPSEGFASIVLFTLLRFPLLVLPVAFNNYANAKVSLKRIERFLLRPEILGRNKIKNHVNQNTFFSTNPQYQSDPAGESRALLSKTTDRSNSRCARENCDDTAGKSVIENRKMLNISRLISLHLKDDKHSDGNKLRSYSRAREALKIKSSLKEEFCEVGEIQGLSFAWEPETTTLKDMQIILYGRKKKFQFEKLNYPEDYENELNISKNNDSSLLDSSLELSSAIEQGCLTCLYGPTGSGKSSLLLAFLGEIHSKYSDHTSESRLLEESFDHGSCTQSIYLTGDVAYVAQRAWIVNASLRDNILFGKPYDPELYDEVLEVCCLKPDLAIMINGDATEIGEKGVNLSGGQQQRVNLARALYSKADIFLLDDVLSAVDPHVGDKIFHQAILKFCVEKLGSCVLLATHQVPLTYKYTDYIWILNRDGSMKKHGHRYDILGENEDVHSLALLVEEEGCFTFEESASKENKVNLPTEDDVCHQSKANSQDGVQDSVEEIGKREREKIRFSLRQSTPEENIKSLATENENKNQQEIGGADKVEAGKLVKEEERESGNMKARLYLEYGYSCAEGIAGIKCLDWNKNRQNKLTVKDLYEATTNPVWIIAVLSLSILYQLGTIFQSTSLSSWVNAMTNSQPTDSTKEKESDSFNMFLYASVTIFLALFVRCCYLVKGAILASRRFHSDILIRIMRSSPQWLDATPLGRIFNRFSDDIFKVDKEVLDNIVRFIDTFFSMLVTIIISIYAVPLLFCVYLPVLIVTLSLGNIYNKCSQQLKRLEAVMKSPVYAHFTEIVNGVTTIRAYEREADFIEKIERDVDLITKLHWYLWVSNFWLAMRLRLCGSLVCLFASLVIVISAYYGALTAAQAGLALSFTIPFAQAINFTIRFHGEMEMSMNAVERLQQYRIKDEGEKLSIEKEHALNSIQSQVNPRTQETTKEIRTGYQLLSERGDVDDLYESSENFRNVQDLKKDKTSKNSVCMSFLSIPRCSTNSKSRRAKLNNALAFSGIPQEASWQTSSALSAPHDNWPEKGSLSFENIWVRYRMDLPYVLKGITFQVQAGERIGVIGRTGSGKSTLMSALFRLIEPEKDNRVNSQTGKIIIDDIDILNIGLHDLRSKLGIIPQDPTLFKGTIRSNLNPTNQYEEGTGSHDAKFISISLTDEDLWTALRQVSLYDTIRALPQQLDSPVDEGGRNFSTGERQLLCFARALLRQSRILVMDEATANIDLETDSKIQQTVRYNLGNTTVLCIAHRLNTIMYYDKVLMLEQGEIIGYDTPFSLLNGKYIGLDTSERDPPVNLSTSFSSNNNPVYIPPNEDFVQMCERSGDMEYLIQLAKEGEEERKRRKSMQHG